MPGVVAPLHTVPHESAHNANGVRTVKDVELSTTAGLVIAYAAWALTLATWTIACIVGSGDMRALSIIVCGVAVTATIRTYFVGLHQMVRNAFELGRDSAPTLIRR